jgi:hypothetical protein
MALRALQLAADIDQAATANRARGIARWSWTLFRWALVSFAGHRFVLLLRFKSASHYPKASRFRKTSQSSCMRRRRHHSDVAT